ncbi:hypothetical protein [Pseudorhizobium halotolerans]|uniref:hypothetical protein n=1 Tax=Pseudorhizobium halotolerans TaxID=1233081 RepID=UPI001156E7D3|nr:hypothetical protein [Pseudorhizobium halotolerans]
MQDVSFEAVATLSRTLRDSFEELSSRQSGLKRNRPGTRGNRDRATFGEGPRLTKGYLSEVAGVIFELHLLYVYPMDDDIYLLPDGFAYTPHETIEDAKAFAKEYGKEQEQTDDVPVDLVFQYADAAIQYVFDYSDEIIGLQGQAEALQAIPRATRAGPGERLGQLAEFLADQLLEPQSALLSRRRPPYNEIAQACSISSTSIYKERYKHLIFRAMNACQGSATDRLALIGEYRALAIEQRLVVRRDVVPDRNASLRAGLPYQGKTTGTASPWPITHVHSSKNSLRSIERAVSDLWTAIYIVIFAWLGERTEQAQALELDCLERGVDGWYIRSRVYKGHDDVTGSYVKRACPDIVAQAINVAVRLGKSAREATGSRALLCETNRHAQSVVDSSTLRNRMASFGARYVCGEDADNVKFVPRHLRRFFVTLWVHYHGYGGKFHALQRYLDHGDLTTTVLYGSRVSRIDAAREEQTRLTVGLFSKFVSDAASFSGAGVKQMQALLARLDCRVGSLKDITNKLEELVRELGMRVYPLGFGYCLWHDRAAARAKCRSGSCVGLGWPEVGKTETVCGDCFNFFTLPIFLGFWERAVKRHDEMIRNENAPDVLRKLSKAGKRIAMRFVRSIRGAG